LRGYGKNQREEEMKNLWERFTAWLSGWPVSAPRKNHRSDKEEDMLFHRQEELAKQTEEK
jgi:hypothetical protein